MKLKMETIISPSLKIIIDYEIGLYNVTGKIIQISA